MSFSSRMIDINAKIEKFFHRLGVAVALFGPVVLTLTLLSFGFFTLGLTGFEQENDLYELWIERDSRLHQERDFVKQWYGSSDTRTEFMMGTARDGGDAFQPEVLASFADATEQIILNTRLELNGLSRDSCFGYWNGTTCFYSWPDVCAPSVATPLFTYPILQGLAIKSLPCGHLTVLDCFNEGRYDYNLNGDDFYEYGTLEQTPQKDRDLNSVAWALIDVDPFCVKPSLKDLSRTTEDNWDTVKGCEMWAGVEVPHNVMFGGITYDDDDNVRGVRSLQNIYNVISPPDLVARSCQLNNYGSRCTSPITLGSKFTVSGVTEEIDASACLLECNAVKNACRQTAHLARDLCFKNGGPCEAAFDTCFNANCTGLTATEGNETRLCGEFTTREGVAESNETLYKAVNWYDTPEFGDIPCDRNNTCEFCIHNHLFYGECHLCREGCLNQTKDVGAACTACVQPTVDQYDDCDDGDAGVLKCLEFCGQCENELFASCQLNDGVDVTKTSLAAEHLLLWEDKLRQSIEAYQRNNPSSAAELDFFLERSGDDLLEEAGEGDVVLIIMGYIGMMAFAIIALSRGDLLESRLSVGVLGVCMVIVSVASSLGLIAMLIKFNPLHSQVLPFLALGLGVDDMFVLAMAFQFRKNLSVPEMTAEAFQEAGASITLTSVVNGIAFAIGSAVPLPVVSDFSLAAMIVVIVNYFMILFAFSSLLVLNAYRVKEDLIDCFPVICLPTPVGCVFPCTLWKCKRREDGTIGCTIKGTKASKTHQDILDPEELQAGEGCNPTKCSKVSAQAIMSKVGQAITAIVTLTFIIIAATGASDAETGLPLADIVPGDSYAAPFLALRERDYGAFSSSVFIGMNEDGKSVDIEKYLFDANFWNDMMKMEREISNVKGTSKRYPMFETSFLDTFLQFQFNYTIDRVRTTTGALRTRTIQRVKQVEGEYPELWQRNATSGEVEQWTSGDGRCPNGWFEQGYASPDSIDTSANPPEVPCSYPADSEFYARLGSFLQSSSGVSSVGNLKVERNSNGIIKVEAIALTFLQDGLYEIDDILQYIKDIRKITDKYRDRYGYPIFPGGFVFDFYEQYLNVNAYLFANLGYVLIGVFFASFFFLFHGVTTFLMMLCIMITIFQIYGFLAFSGLKINGVCVVNLVMGVGVSVEFTAHIARVFMIVSGTRAERATKALETMFFPIVLGSVSTFIGNFPMYFANFPYFRLYFFNMYVLIIFFGTFNGLCLLPMMLSYVGPASLRAEDDKGAEKDVEMTGDSAPAGSTE